MDVKEQLKKFEQAMNLLDEIAQEYPSKRWEGDCLFEDFYESLSDEDLSKLRDIHDDTYWKPFSIFI